MHTVRPGEKRHACAAPPAALADRAAFTLLDTLIVVVLLAIVAMAALPALTGSRQDVAIRRAATELVSALHYAAGLAILHERPFGVQVDTNANRIQVYDLRYRKDAASHHDADPPVNTNGVVLNPLDKKWYEVCFSDDQGYEGVKIAKVAGGPDVVFYPDGHSSELGTRVALRCADIWRVIAVDGATGRVNVNAP